jgi:hypothetical protein
VPGGLTAVLMRPGKPLDFFVRTREKYPLTKVVSHRFPLSEVKKAFEMPEGQGKNTAGSAATRVILEP